MHLFETNLESWKRVYLYGEKTRVNRGMAFGRMMADGLEHGEVTGDAVLDLLMERLPKFEIMDQPVECELPIKGQKPIPILIKPDTMRPDMTGFKEYKTGQAPWSRKQVDESGQITFYATGLYLKSGKIPKDIELVHVLTAKEDIEAVDGKIGATGDIWRHPTVRTMRDVLLMMGRMKKAWEGIQKITAEELL